MKFSKPFLAALAALPLMTVSDAEAGQRCKTYTKHIRNDGNLDFGYAKACRMQNGVWEIVKMKAKRNQTRIILAEHIYDDLFDRGYDVLVDARYDHKIYNNGYYAARYNTRSPRYYYEPQRHQHSKRASYHGKKLCGARY